MALVVGPVLVMLAWGASAQGPSKCDGLVDSLRILVDAQPARAVAVARQLYANCRNDGDALYSGGRILNRAARPDSSGKYRALRDQAERLLSRAVALQPKNAAAWLEYGFTVRKRGGVPVDADRAIGRALALADEDPSSTPPEQLAEMHLLRARYLQYLLDRLRALKDGSRLGVFTPACSDLGLFCENYENPSRFNDQLRELPALDPDFRGRRERLLGFYRAAVRLAPQASEGVLRFARELAIESEWEPLVELTSAALTGHPDSAFVALIQAMGLQRLGRLTLSESLFVQGISRLPDTMRHWYIQPPSGFPEWNRARPLRLTSYDEQRLEFWARVTYALLAFADPELVVEGPATPQGDALLRYGWPDRVSQVEREAAKLLSEARRYAVNYFLTCIPADAGGDPTNCELPGAQATARDESGGRWVFWTYDNNRPSLIFEQRPGVRVPRYVRQAVAEEYAERLRQRTPLTFSSRVAPHQFQLPRQVARFRGGSPDQTTVALYGLLPAQQMDLPPRDSLSVGLFVFRDTTGFPLLVEQRATAVPGEALALSYRVPLGPGRYAYSLEAFAPARGVAGTARDSLVAPTWAPGSLQLSDLLIAHRVEAPRDSEPRTWRDLMIEPSRTLEVQKGASLWAVWETYGLRAGLEGTARYLVTFALRDRNARSAPLRLLERLGVGRRQGTPAVALEWTAERRLAPDGRALEYVAVQLPEDATGQYELVVTVSDPATGRSAKTHRTIAITDASP